jgi:hypothetical protein
MLQPVNIQLGNTDRVAKDSNWTCFIPEAFAAISEHDSGTHHQCKLQATDFQILAVELVWALEAVITYR